MLAPNPLSGQRPGSPAPAGRFSRAARSSVRAGAVPARRTEEEPMAGASLIKSLAASLLLFLIVWEWLRPLPMLASMTELYLIKPFLIAFGFGLLLDGLRLPVPLSLPLKALIVLSLVGYLFYPEQVLGVRWLAQLTEQVKTDILAMLQGQYEQVSGATRTLLFAAGWSIILSVVHTLLIQRQQVLWLGGMTILYLVLLQLLFGVDTVEGIIRTFLCTGLLLALLLPESLKRKYGVTLPAGKALKAIAAAALLIVLCVGAGLFGWKPEGSSRLMAPFDYSVLERWPFTVFGSEAASTAAASKVSAKTGYSTDDSALGGPISPDPSVVFEAKTSELTYWRGESKDIYDGKGWHQSASKLGSFLPPPSAASGADDSAVSVRQEVMLPPEHPTRLLFLGGALREAQALISPADHLLPQEYLRFDAAAGSYSLPELSDPVSYYEVQTSLKSPRSAQLQADQGAYPAEMTDTYLQLPESFPQRVRLLAESITAGKQGSYAKAAAIAEYLRTHYKYSLSRPTVPAEGEDFVEHFLFVDQTGYCDHFSTAMVVMLRSVGVPARWVKGFAPGSEEPGVADGDGDGLHHVTVHNSDAHSWVEVGFPTAGWIAFDPTPGFSGAGMAALSDAKLAAGALTASASATRIDAMPSDQGSKLLPADQPEKGAAETKTSMKIAAFPLLAAAEKAGRAALSLVQRHAWLTALGMLLCGSILIGLYLARSHLKLAALTIRSSRGRTEPHSGIVAFMDMLWLKIYRTYGDKRPQETVREYVSRIDIASERAGAALVEFAKLYELARYDTAKRLPVARRAVYELWKRMAEPK